MAAAHSYPARWQSVSATLFTVKPQGLKLMTFRRVCLACSGSKVRKTSRRDLAYVIANELDGATTVSATMLLAHKAGIAVFVTGGKHLFSSAEAKMSSSFSPSNFQALNRQWGTRFQPAPHPETRAITEFRSPVTHLAYWLTAGVETLTLQGCSQREAA